MESIILLGVLEGLIITLLILLKHRKTVSDYLLSGFFLLYSLNTLLSYLEIYNRTHDFPYPMFIFVSSPLLLLHGPAIWMYVKSLTDQHFSFKPIYLLHLLPFLLCVLDFTVQYYTIPAVEKIEILQSESFKHRIDYPLMIIAMALSSLIYFSWAVLLVKRYNQKIKGYFSETLNYDLVWLRIVMVASVIVYTIIYVPFLADLVFPIASFQWMHKASFILGSIYLIVLGFFGHKQGNLFSDKPIQMELSEPQPMLSETYSLDQKENDFIHSLLAYMNATKPYLNTEITLTTLASELEVSPEYLSKILNGRLGKNFFDFINHYRIEEFKTRCNLPENKNYTLIAIAYDCGFSSKATFNRVFKNATGQTPGDYSRKSH
ncbi:MAG TPA: helix-turn-helix domain-containing protein [Prolixibacteraceae bacterium]|nr:helix-turn-helix domain-containing protein [Prolixibacteraceae bacterium]HPS12448.1 helix-turn-helix domain-containing protein [Prolixibacteraceae bacterium]